MVSNSITDSPLVDMKTDISTFVNEIKQLCPHNLKTLYNWLFFLNTSIPDGNTHHAMVVELMFDVVKNYPSSSFQRQQPLITGLKATWNQFTAVLYCSDAGSVSKIIAFLKSDHDLLQISDESQISFTDNLKPPDTVQNAKNSKPKNSGIKKTNDTDN